MRVVRQALESEVYRLSLGLAVDITVQHYQSLEGFQLFVKTLLLAKLVDEDCQTVVGLFEKRD